MQMKIKHLEHDATVTSVVIKLDKPLITGHEQG